MDYSWFRLAYIAGIRIENECKNSKKPAEGLTWRAFMGINWATSYSPTHLRVQYHRG
jgi:hypothetical protein